MRNDAVVILGASSPTGLLLARELSQSGVDVTAVSRGLSHQEELATLPVTLKTADAMNRQALYQSLETAPQDAVFISLLGGTLADGRRLPFEAYRNAIDAALEFRATRFVLISTVGCGDSRQALIWLFRRLLGAALSVRDQAENYLRQSGMPWTIIRPGALPQRAGPTGRGILTQSQDVMGAIHRADLAHLIVRAIAGSQTINGTYTAVDSGRIWHPFGGQIPAFRI